ncbi:MAG TPA: ABC transporter ATP-binding protein, partial [Terriglobia bacterium]|nr:ABC transporter ATP-binding protein [Terriglobia bacterium]
MPIVQVENLSKEFRTFKRREGVLGAIQNLFVRERVIIHAVDHVSFTIEPGEMVGYIGANGAGKSTTIKMLTGLLAPTSGSVALLGLDFAAHPIEVKRQIGVVPEGMGLLERLTGSEYLQFVGRMYGLDRATTQGRTHELLDFMQLADRPKTLIADYSHGMQKKLALAAAVI